MLFIVGFLALFLLLWVVFYAVGPRLERLLARSGQRLARFRYRDYLPVVVVVIIGIGVTATAGDAFLDLAEGVTAKSPAIAEADARAYQWARTTHSSGATLFFTVMTIIGTPAGLAVIAALCSIYLFVNKRWRWAAYLFLTGSIGGLLNLQLKSYFARARPELAQALRDAHGYSFPSGHAMGSTVVFGALAYLTFRILHRWRPRAAALSLCCTFIVSICVSRIYLGVHWISDIGAGVAAGLVWLITATVAYEGFRRIRLVRALRRSRSDAQ
ncbi:MAG TPA: phosphatase PAP2 family protein [Thermoanaerobaculia bacterium]